MSIADLIQGHTASAVALHAPDRASLLYSDLSRLIEQTVHRLNQLGIGRGHCVAAVLPNGPELAVAFLAVSAGTTFAPLNPAYSQREFCFYLTDLKAAALLLPSGFCPAAAQAAQSLGIPVLTLTAAADGPAGAFYIEGRSISGEPARPGIATADEIALLLHSSGTTARPKLIPLTHRNLVASSRNIVRTLQLTPADRCLNVMPLFHIHGLVGALLSSLAAGASVYCTPGFNAHRFFRWLDDSAATWYSAVPTMHQLILSRENEPNARPRLRFVRSSSAHLHTRTWMELESRFGCPVLNAYGMTEAAHQVATNPLPPGRVKYGTVGVSGATEHVILDDSGRIMPAGTVGEVALRGETVTAGYLVPPEANQTAFTAGWFRTGDSGVVDGDGYLTLTGRLKEIINCGGEKVSPAEVDQVLMECPGITAAVTFGAPCATLGERICAAVVLRAGSDIDENGIRDFARDRLARFKVPRQVLILNEIPKGATGKIQRIGLAERLGLN